MMMSGNNPTTGELQHCNKTPPPRTSSGSSRLGATTTAAAAAATAISSASSSRLQSILAAGHDQLRRIDELEHKIDERVIRARRRICSILDNYYTEQQSFRRSHLRCFVTHAYQKQQQQQQDEAHPTAAEASSIWMVRLEGRLLIGHLDHASAAAFDEKTNYNAPNDDLDRSKGEKGEELAGEEVKAIQFTHFFDKVQVQFQSIYSPKPNPMAAPFAFASKAAADAAAEALASKSTTLSSKKRRGAGTTTVGAGATAGTAPGAAGAGQQPGIDPRRPFMQSARIEMEWTKASTPSLQDAMAFDFQYDAPPPPEHSYQEHSVVCTMQLYPNTGSSSGGGSIGNSSNKDPPALYQVSPELSKALFPHHGPSEHSQATAAAASAAAAAAASDAEAAASAAGALASPPLLAGKKRKTPDDDVASPLDNTSAILGPDCGIISGPPPTDNSIEIPDGLTMKEITVAFFHYIRDKKLCTGGGGGDGGDDDDDGYGSSSNDYVRRSSMASSHTNTDNNNDASTFLSPGGTGGSSSLDYSIHIPCDKTLQSVLQVKYFSFCNLQKLLIARNLIRPIHTEPIRLTYIMMKDTATPSLTPALTWGADVSMADEDAAQPTMLQLDMDVAVPALFPYRARELLRRIKRRELEYTSSRTKARYLLMSRRAKDEEQVKHWIDALVSTKSKGCSVRQQVSLQPTTTTTGPSDLLTPITLALAKSAPPRTEARMSAHLDTRLSHLLTQLQQRQQRAQAAWQRVEYQAAAAAASNEASPPPTMSTRMNEEPPQGK
jgi:hypothetical protein